MGCLRKHNLLNKHQPIGKQMMEAMTKLVVITLLPGVPGSGLMAEGEVGCSDMI